MILAEEKHEEYEQAPVVLAPRHTDSLAEISVQIKRITHGGVSQYPRVDAVDAGLFCDGQSHSCLQAHREISAEKRTRFQDKAGVLFQQQYSIHDKVRVGAYVDAGPFFQAQQGLASVHAEDAAVADHGLLFENANSVVLVFPSQELHACAGGRCLGDNAVRQFAVFAVHHHDVVLAAVVHDRPVAVVGRFGR